MNTALLLLWFTFLSPSNSYTITSCVDSCGCYPNEACLINCTADRSCQNAVINVNTATSVTINCEGSNSCSGSIFDIERVPLNTNINCTGYQSCQDTTFEWQSIYSSPFILDCSNLRSCDSAQINAGIAAEVTVNCNGEWACLNLRLDCGNSAPECTLRCDYGYQRSCRDLITFDCGISQCLMYCDDSLESCKNIYGTSPITTNAVSFECIGNGCTGPTNEPTTAEPTMIFEPTTAEPTTNEPTTAQPTAAETTVNIHGTTVITMLSTSVMDMTSIDSTISTNMKETVHTVANENERISKRISVIFGAIVWMMVH